VDISIPAIKNEKYLPAETADTGETTETVESSVSSET
jgi:hypothetical protein